MKKLKMAALLLGSMLSVSASADLIFDADVTSNVIMGSGVTNGSFTVAQANGVELGLRGKLRHNAAGAPENTYNSNSDGTYSFDAGVAPTQAAPTAVWSFEWSINSNFDGNGGDLDDYTYVLGLDTDPTAAVSMFNFDPINDVNPNYGVVAWDHSIGDNSTGNGAGTETVGADTAGYASLTSTNNLAQNSWKAHWFFGPGFDPTLDATYDISLTAFDANGGLAATTLIQIIVGAGATEVPEPGTMALLLTGLLGLATRRRFAK
ncbi:PEP-CTERM sorting domain-containing protein [uncultured Paraglaciecola sp.]|uniref:PEP-CTERM sorting domain-containing protein n=1 Tax=uncultured Paraglaciecola sp. TaxID=1765024 RepID=UPI0030D860E4|tara:strand:- start:91097 stop:91885 length:789 start_codon:yes stop_codon:yes gene_type:complete